MSVPVSVLATLLLTAAAQAPDDPVLRSAVEHYYAALEAEDIEAYLALWSSTAQRPQRESVKYLFESADERFSDIQILRATAVNGRLRVRLSVHRETTRRARTSGAAPTVTSSTDRAALTFVREGDALKVVSEGSPESDLAAAYLAADNGEERQALLAAEADLVGPPLVAAMLRVAGLTAATQQYSRAELQYKPIAELAAKIGARREQGEALQNLGNTQYFQRRFADALATYQRRLQIERERGDDAAVASALVGVATAQYSLAEYSEAFPAYRQALAIHERLDDRPSTASTLISTGNIRYLQGDYAGAVHDYSRSRELYRELSDSDGDARALEGLGRSYEAQGDFAGALTAFTAVLAQGRTRSDRSRQGTATQKIADVHLRLGNVDAARQHYQESRDHFLAAKDAAGAGRVWQGLGMTELLAGRYEAGEQAYRTSATLCGGIQDDECSAHATVGLAFAQSAQDKFAEAVASYRQAIEAFASLGAREAGARAEIGLSQALAGTGQLDAAVAAATRARHAAMALDNDDIVWRALIAEARAVRKQANPSQAVAIARAAAGVVERMHAAAIEKPATAIPTDATAAFATLAVLLAETGDSIGSRAAASRMRAVELRTTLAVNEREIVRGMTADEREQERAAAVELQSLLAQAARQRALPKPDAARIAAVEERITAAAAARTSWMKALYDRKPDLRVWRGLAPPPAADQLRDRLGEGTLVLELVVDEDDVLVIASAGTPDGRVVAGATPVRRRMLAERVSALLHLSARRDPTAWRKAAIDIVELVPPGVRELLAAAPRVVIVPHDILWRVPFEALPLAHGHLGSGAVVTYARSEASIERAAMIRPVPVSSVAAVAAPELTTQARERLLQTAPDWSLRTAEASARELKALVPVYSGDFFVVPSGGPGDQLFGDKGAQASALHIAAPFRINGASPLFSPIVISADAGSGTRHGDGTIEARELINVNLNARAAVLSDGAAMSMRDGAAGAGVIAWAWLAAGVRSLLITRWTTDPEASDALLVEFHRRLRSGAAPADALHGARAAIRAKPQWAAPYYWAGWFVTGV